MISLLFIICYPCTTSSECYSIFLLLYQHRVKSKNRKVHWFFSKYDPWCFCPLVIIFSLIFRYRDFVCALNFHCKRKRNLINIKHLIIFKAAPFLLETQTVLSCFDETLSECRVPLHDVWLLLSFINFLFTLSMS